MLERCIEERVRPKSGLTILYRIRTLDYLSEEDLKLPKRGQDIALHLW